MLLISKFYKLYLDCDQKVCTDTRKITNGCLFICLVGANFDGNEFAQKAIEMGAKYVISSNIDFCNESTTFFTKDSLVLLQKLAIEHRKTFKIPVLGIGWSNGKTTSKELCKLVAKTKYKTYATGGNFNNHIGVPLSILETPKDTEIAIYEMGTNNPGEMQVLCEICQPSMVLVTNVGKEHLEGFGNMEAIALEESVIIKYAQNKGGQIILNSDDDWFSQVVKPTGNIIRYGLKSISDVYAKIETSMPKAHYNLYIKNDLIGNYKLKIGGDFNVQNTLAAIAFGLLININPNECALACAEYTPENNRSQWISSGNRQIMMDAYNANPSSVEVSLSEFAKIAGNKLAILGDMYELGAHAVQEHMNIFKLTQQLQIPTFFCGEIYSEVLGNNAMVFKNKSELIEAIKNQRILKFVLIKGSRGMKMEEVLPCVQSAE